MSLLSRALVAAAARMGLTVSVRRTPRDNSYPQAVNVPMATYAPWKHDAEFLALYEKVRAHTLVDLYRCHELWQLVAQSAKCSGGLLEVGVWRGGTGALIAQRARQLGITDPVYCCDTFTGLKKVGAQDPAYRNDDYNDTSAAHVEALFRQLGLDNARVLPGMFPEDSGHLVREPKIRFCHIDVDVYQGAKDVFAWVWGRLDAGGIVVFDDYGFAGPVGVTRCVEEMREAPDRVVIHNLNGHAVIVKTR